MWAWPARYTAKTKFIINNQGRLINGQQEALVSLTKMREYNMDYLTKEDHYIAGWIIKGVDTITEACTMQSLIV